MCHFVICDGMNFASSLQASTCTQPKTMQVIACMDSPELTSKPLKSHPSSVDVTRKRILAAAELVFSRDGFQGATTREIAREADVNEVTLFRHFRTRDELLRATLEHGCAAYDALIRPDEVWESDLRGRLEIFVRESYAIVRHKEAIVRAFISEARVLPETTRKTLQEFMLKRKASVVARLQQAQKAGLVRTDVDLSAAADFIRDSIHSAMLRHTAYGTSPEQVASHLSSVTEIFYQGIKA
jgi:AcrR family transcriptional regulator